MNNNYCIHCSMDCKDDKTHRLSYDIIPDYITDGAINEFGRFFKEIEDRFPGVRFWVTKGTENGMELMYNSSKVEEEPLAYNGKLFIENFMQSEIYTKED